MRLEVGVLGRAGGGRGATCTFSSIQKFHLGIFFFLICEENSARTEPRMEREGTKTMRGEKLKKEEQREEGRGEKKDLCL